VSEGPGPEFTRGVLQNFFLTLLSYPKQFMLSDAINAFSKSVVNPKPELSCWHKQYLKSTHDD